MNLRRFNDTDVDAVTQLMIEGMRSWGVKRIEGTDSISKRLLEPSRESWVAERDGQLLGFVSWQPELSSFEPRPEAGLWDAHLGGLYVAGPWRGAGLADRLHKHALRRLRAEGYEHVRLWTPEIAERARAFYESCGYLQTGRHLDRAGLVRIEYLLPLS